MREFESIVRDLETGKAKLDDAVKAYERGAALKAHCEASLPARKQRSSRLQSAVTASSRLPHSTARNPRDPR